MNENSITIIGSGVAGSFLALLFAKRGYQVTIYEQLSKADIYDSNSKRSYNITIYQYGAELLKKAQLWDELQPHIIPTLKKASTQLEKHTKPVITPIDHTKMQYYVLTRSGLLNVLMTHIEKNPLISVHYEISLLTIDRYKKTLLVQHTKTKAITETAYTVIFGADGVNSTVRMWLQQGKASSHSQEYAPWSYKQFFISKAWAEQLGLTTDTTYTWSREKACIASFPNIDGSFSALFMLPHGKHGFTSFKSEKDVEELFIQEFPTLLPLPQEVGQELVTNPEGNFVTVHTDPWYYKDMIALVGDAAHGFNPFFGQGTSAAFGDDFAIIDLVDQYGPDWARILPLYQEQRKAHMDALGELSKAGLKKYLRNKRGDYEAVYDALEAKLHEFFPHIQAPLHKNVILGPDKTHTHVKNHKKQRAKAKWLGVPVAVGAVTGLIRAGEKTKYAYRSVTNGLKRNS